MCAPGSKWNANALTASHSVQDAVNMGENAWPIRGVAVHMWGPGDQCCFGIAQARHLWVLRCA
eukprot:1031171-Heterocapsa_arctica.AAC.1